MHALQYRAIWLRQPMTATAVQAAGAVTGIAAALAWCGGVPPNRLVPLLAVFLILTIAGERLELARLASPGVRAERLLLILAVGLAVTVLLTLTMPVVAVPVAGILMLLMVAWLLRYDIVRGTIRQPASRLDILASGRSIRPSASAGTPSTTARYSLVTSPASKAAAKRL